MQCVCDEDGSEDIHCNNVKESTCAVKISQLTARLSLSPFCFQLLNGRRRLSPAQAATHSRHSNSLPAGQVAGSRLEAWKEHESANGAGLTAGSQAGAGGGGRGRRREEVDEYEEEEEDRGQTYPLQVLSGYPVALDTTLQHIVQQLDILTQVSSSLAAQAVDRNSH